MAIHCGGDQRYARYAPVLWSSGHGEKGRTQPGDEALCAGLLEASLRPLFLLIRMMS